MHESMNTHNESLLERFPGVHRDRHQSQHRSAGAHDERNHPDQTRSVVTVVRVHRLL